MSVDDDVMWKKRWRVELCAGQKRNESVIARQNERVSSVTVRLQGVEVEKEA